MFALFAGIYYWFPKINGRMMSDYLGRVHFWLSLIFMNLIFLPMLAQGMAGMNRRLADGGAAYVATTEKLGLPRWTIALHPAILYATCLLAVAQLPFVFNLFWSLFKGIRVSKNPWQATTLEWQSRSPPGDGDSPAPLEVYRGPYEYSPPGWAQDYLPQNIAQSK